MSFHNLAASTCILQVFPKLYLPVMTENNLRVLKPWRAYIPSLTQLQHKAKVRQLNSYIKRLLHQRWAARHRNGSSAGNSQDVLERIMQALEVNDSLHVHLHMPVSSVAMSSSNLSQVSLHIASWVLAKPHQATKAESLNINVFAL